MPKGGSKPGERRGGRQKGARNKSTIKAEQLAQEAVGKGMTPLAFMLKLMRDSKKDTGVRLDAAKCAAQYVHPRLASVALHGPNEDGSFTFNVNLSGADARA